MSTKVIRFTSMNFVSIFCNSMPLLMSTIVTTSGSSLYLKKHYLQIMYVTSTKKSMLKYIAANGHYSKWMQQLMDVNSWCTFLHIVTTANGCYSSKTKVLMDAKANECCSNCILLLMNIIAIEHHGTWIPLRIGVAIAKHCSIWTPFADGRCLYRTFQHTTPSTTNIDSWSGSLFYQFFCNQFVLVSIKARRPFDE